MRQGTVVMFHPTRHWGFIRENDGTQWFFHQSNAIRYYIPKLSDMVQFEIGPPITLGKKDQAINIAPLGAESGVGGGK
jgi:cold shock CspA family protein